MINQYPFEGFSDEYPETDPTPDWFGFGLKHREMRTSPVKHLVMADGGRVARIEVRCGDDCNHLIQAQIMDKLKGKDAERPLLPIAQGMSYNRTPGNGHFGDPMWQLPDTRPGRFLRDTHLPEVIHNPVPIGKTNRGR